MNYQEQPQNTCLRQKANGGAIVLLPYWLLAARDKRRQQTQVVGMKTNENTTKAKTRTDCSINDDTTFPDRLQVATAAKEKGPQRAPEVVVFSLLEGIKSGGSPRRPFFLLLQ